MLEINMQQAKKLGEFLEEFNAKGVKFAQRNAINDMAFDTMRTARATIRDDFVNRNKWTQGSVRVERARTTQDFAQVGSTEDYMAHQEFGHTKTQHTHNPMPAASGESNRASVRRRPVRKANRMANISLRRRRRGVGSRAEQNIVALKEAKADGRKFVYLDRGKVKGIYRVMGTKRKPKARMIQDMSRRVAHVPRNPWLTPSTDAVVARAPAIYHARLAQELRRLR